MRAFSINFGICYWLLVVIILHSLLLPIRKVVRKCTLVTHPHRYLKTSQNLLFTLIVAEENLKRKKNTSW